MMVGFDGNWLDPEPIVIAALVRLTNVQGLIFHGLNDPRVSEIYESATDPVTASVKQIREDLRLHSDWRWVITQETEAIT